MEDEARRRQVKTKALVKAVAGTAAGVPDSTPAPTVRNSYGAAICLLSVLFLVGRLQTHCSYSLTLFWANYRRDQQA